MKGSITTECDKNVNYLLLVLEELGVVVLVKHLAHSLFRPS